MFCKNCGNELKDGEKFCGKCEALQNMSEQDALTNPAPTIQTVQTGKNRKRLLIIIIGIIIAIVLVVVILVNIFGNSLSVKDVKAGYLTYFSKSKTIGSAFDNYSYFDDISWKEFDGETDDGEEVSIVEFNATIQMDNYDWYEYSDASDYAYETLTVQFYTDDNMDSDEFEIYGIWFSNVDDEGTDINLDDYDFEDILNSIYEDEIFVLIPSDYGLYYYN